ncbi:MAG: hypothetical protein O3B04_01825 [Chloroflexi bacterium]|nr:hypothetical protein [Chloroflexota bacterium]
MDDVTFQFVPALVAGIAATVAALLVLMVMLAVAPTLFPFNPLYLIGSAFSIDTTSAYGWALGVLLLIGAAYGVFVSAVFTGFQVTELEFLWGALTGAALSVVIGTTLAYARSLNRAVRAGQVGEPGPFLLRYGWRSVTQLVAVHVLFGLIAGVVYTTLT